MPDFINPFDTLPNEIVDAILDRLPNVLDKGAFELACQRFYEVGFANVPVQRQYFYSFFNDSKSSHLHESSRLIKKFLLHVARGEKAQAEEMIRCNPCLLKESATITDYSGRVIEGTALRIALGAKDVSCGSKCHLVKIAPPGNGQLLTVGYIRNQINQLNDQLRRHEAITNTIYIRCGDKLLYLDIVNNERLTFRSDQAWLEAFDKKLQPQIRPKLLSKEQLNQITSASKHDPEEEMAEMIMRHLRQTPDGEKEIAKQIKEQFPEGWEKEEAERVKRDAEALKKVTEAIEKAREGDPCEAAIKVFCDYLEHEYKGKGVIKTGYYFNDKLLEDALKYFDKMYEQFGGRGSHKNNLVWQKVIGGIERYATGCLAQALCQGPHQIIKGGCKLRRSLELSNWGANNGRYFPLDLIPYCILGRDAAVDLLGYMDTETMVEGFHGTREGQYWYSNYNKQKALTLQRYMPQPTMFPENPSENACVVM